MRKIIFLIIFGLLFTNLAYAEEITVTNVKINCINLNSNLKQGMKGNENVVILQNFLKEKGYLSTNATGFFGPLTLKAVKAFQKTNNISATGFVGPVTRALINKVTCINLEPSTIITPIPENTTTTPPPSAIIPTEPAVVTTPVVVEDVILTAPNNSSLRVRTDSSLSITSNSISVRGTVTAGARSGTEAWFELTTNPNVYKTSETTITPRVIQKTNDKFEYTFVNLQSSTNYYYRACAENTSLGQKSCGSTTNVKTN